MSTSQTRFRSIVGLAVVALVVSVLPLSAPAAAVEEPAPPLEIERVIDAPTPDIVGGTEATPGEYPFAVDIELHVFVSYFAYDPIFDRWITKTAIATKQCAGTLIEPEWVLTAAHCFNFVSVDDPESPFGTYTGSVEVDDLELHIGRHDLTTTVGETFDAVAVFVHPDYGFETKSPYDVALVRLEGPSGYQPVDLATSAETGLYSSGTMGTAIGWGHTSSGGSSSSVLMEVEIPTLSDESCSFILGSDFFPAIELCAGDIYDGGEDTCQGDSGGPFLVPNGSGWTQAGVTSWGIGCGTIVPAVYTEVAGFRDWITETIALTPLHEIEAHDPMFTPQSDHVVYWEAPTAIDQTLYSVPTAGGAPTALSPAVFGRAPALAITDDGKTVVYGVSEDEFAYGSTMDLYAVPIEGPIASRVLLGDDVPFSTEVILHPDGTAAFYEVDEQIHQVDLATGSSTVLSPVATNPDDQIIALDITSDGRYAVWQGDPTVDGKRELTAADLSTGASWTLAAFDSADMFSGMVVNWLLTPDGTRVVYTTRVDESTHGMYSVPITGTVGDETLIGDVETLHYFSTEIAPYGEWWAITGDSERVMYYRERPVTEGLYSVPVTGSPADEVALITGIDLGSLADEGVQFTSTHVIVETPGGVLSIPAAGPASAATDLGIDPGDAWRVSPRGDLVSFIAGGESGSLGLVPVGGSAADIEIISADDVDEVVWSADGSHLAYTETWSGDLFWMSVDGDWTPVELARTRTKESDGADTVALSPEGEFVLYVADVRWPDVRETWLAAPYGPRYVAAASVSGDFSGDGKTDVAMYDAGSGLWSVGVSTGTSVSLAVWSDVPIRGYDTVLVGDFDGDGRDDIAMYVNASGHWWVLVSDGSGFSTSSWSKFTASISISSQYVGDFNGDGLDDVANFEVTTGKWWVSLSLPGLDRFGTSTWSKFTASLELPTQLIGDINGDGLDDLANYHLDSGKWFLSLSDGTRFLTYVGADFTDGRVFFNQFIGDFDGDGKDDLASYDNVSGEWLISLSEGTSLADPVQWSRFTSSIAITDQFIGDFDGDGNADVANFEVTTGKWWMSLGAPDQGRFLTSTWSKFTPSLVLDPQLIGDLNGDGRDDLLNYLPASRRWFGSISTGSSFATYILGDA